MLTNLDSVIRAHDSFLAGNERMVDDALEVAGRHALDHVQKYPAFRSRSGALQKATKARVVRTSGGKLLKITNTKKYAQAIDTGARAHVIRPRRARFLRFRVGGRMVYAKRVQHPGNRPYKFAYRAANSSHRVLGDYLNRGMTTLAQRF